MQKTFSLALLVLIAVPACGSESDLDVAEEQRSLWEDSAITEYTVEVESELSGIRYHARVAVNGSETTMFGLPGGTELAGDLTAPDLTVDGLFDIVITALQDGDAVVVEYDDALGIPTRAEIHRDDRIDSFRVEVFSQELLGPPDMELLPTPVPPESGARTPGSVDNDLPSFELER